jgi:hypothetical protein
MRWLEIISVEPAGPKEKDKIVEFFNKIRAPQSAILNVYGNLAGNELSIHIQWSSQSAPEGGRSPLGRELCRAISDHGLVAHAMWMEGNQSKSGAPYY